MWTGKFKGVKGYKTYMLKSSRCIAGIAPSARYYEDGMFFLIYRRKCEGVDKRVIRNGLREILRFNGRHLVTATYDAGSTTIEFYCFLEGIPSKETMEKTESFLKTSELH